MSEELHETIQNANAPMVFTERDAKDFHSEQICHICEKELPDNSTDEDHLKKNEHLLSELGLNLNQLPTSKEVNAMKYEGEENSQDHISWANNKKKLLDYLKANNKIVVRDHDHFTSNIFLKVTKVYNKYFLR